MELSASVTKPVRYLCGKPVAVAAVAGFLLFGPAFAQDGVGTCPSAGSRPVNVREVLSGDAFLTSEGEEVRLAGVLAPGSDAIGAPDAEIALARDYMAKALQGRSVSVALEGGPQDRYGRLTAQIYVDGLWLQEELLATGRVRAMPDLAALACTDALLEAESTARALDAGFWGDGRFSVLTPEELVANERGFAGTFQIVEGRVLSVGDFRGRYFLNFGEDYQTDFTVTVAPEDMRNFRASNFDLDTLEGRRVRVRGWLESYNGPNMPIATPSAIELLD